MLGIERAMLKLLIVIGSVSAWNPFDDTITDPCAGLPVDCTESNDTSIQTVGGLVLNDEYADKFSISFANTYVQIQSMYPHGNCGTDFDGFRTGHPTQGDCGSIKSANQPLWPDGLTEISASETLTVNLCAKWCFEYRNSCDFFQWLDESTDGPSHYKICNLRSYNSGSSMHDNAVVMANWNHFERMTGVGDEDDEVDGTERGYDPLSYVGIVALVLCGLLFLYAQVSTNERVQFLNLRNALKIVRNSAKFRVLRMNPQEEQKLVISVMAKKEPV